uniref:IlGF domain-containing protein n=1 Tax=Caenorhabditis tropicalis TaxID=1561998 RepID=A0A1I7U5B0_9PELO
MKFLLLVLLILPFSAVLSEISGEKVAHLRADLEKLTKKELDILYRLDVAIQDFKTLMTPESKLRSRRKLVCGKKLKLDVARVCGDVVRDLPTDIDLSTECCHTACSDEIIKKAMCPSKSS